MEVISNRKMGQGSRALHTNHCLAAIHHSKRGSEALDERLVLDAFEAICRDMLFVELFLDLTEDEAETESGDDVKSRYSKTKPSEWGDRL